MQKFIKYSLMFIICTCTTTHSSDDIYQNRGEQRAPKQSTSIFGQARDFAIEKASQAYEQATKNLGPRTKERLNTAGRVAKQTAELTTKAAQPVLSFAHKKTQDIAKSLAEQTKTISLFQKKPAPTPLPTRKVYREAVVDPNEPPNVGWRARWDASNVLAKLHNSKEFKSSIASTEHPFNKTLATKIEKNENVSEDDIVTAIKGGANSLMVYPSGETLLHKAAQYHRTDLAKLLLEGLDPNTQDDTGKTPLHLAIGMENRNQWVTDEDDIIRILLEHGADPDIIDNFGKKAASDAPYYKDNLALKKLRQHAGALAAEHDWEDVGDLDWDIIDSPKSPKEAKAAI